MPYVKVGQENSGELDIAVAGSAIAVECIAIWETDFRADVASFDIK